MLSLLALYPARPKSCWIFFRLLEVRFKTELCSGLPILNLSAPLRGGGIARLTPNRVSLRCPTGANMGKTVVTLMKKPFYPVSERTSPSASRSTVFSTTLVIQTRSVVPVQRERRRHLDMRPPAVARDFCSDLDQALGVIPRQCGKAQPMTFSKEFKCPLRARSLDWPFRLVN